MGKVAVQQSDQLPNESSDLALTLNALRSHQKPFDSLGHYETNIKLGKQPDGPFDALGSYQYKPTVKARKQRYKKKKRIKSKRRCLNDAVAQASYEPPQQVFIRLPIPATVQSPEQDSEEILKISKNEQSLIFMQNENDNERVSLLVQKTQHFERIERSNGMVEQHSASMVKICAIASEKSQISNKQIPSSENIDEYLMRHRNTSNGLSD